MKIEIETGRLSTIFIFFLLFPHFKTPYIEIVPLLDMIFNILRVISTFTILCLIAFNADARTDDNSSWRENLLLYLGYFGSILISTIVNRANTYLFIILMLSQLSALIICQYYASVSPLNLIRAIFLVGELYVYINFITLLLYPEGMWRDWKNWTDNWFLGFKNQFIPYFLVFFVAALLRMRFVGGYLRSVLLIIIMMISLILADSSTSIVIFVLMVMALVLTQRSKGGVINAVSLSIINVMAFILVVILRSNVMFSFIFDIFLNKSRSMTLRTGLWDEIMNLIRERPLLGYGYRSGKETSSFLGQGTWAVHAHNMVIECLFIGGVFCLSFFLIINIRLVNRLYCNRIYYLAQVLAICLFGLNIGYLTEAYNLGIVFATYGLVGTVDYLKDIESIYESKM